jgi:hypothetical protein
VISMQVSIYLAAETSPAEGRIWHRSDSGSKAFSGPFNDLLTLERHGARTLGNLRARLCSRFAALAAAVMLNHQQGRPSRSLAVYAI